MHDLLNAFPGQERDEPVFVFARPYPLAFLPTALVFLLVFGFGVAFQYLIYGGFVPGLPYSAIVGGVLAVGLFNLFVLIVFLVTILDFYFDIVIVTDRRVVDIDQEMLFYRRISELSLENVEDVSSVVRGLFGTAFDYGAVEIQTAGERENFMMQNVRFPREITAITVDLASQAHHEVPPAQRVPESQFVAVISNQTLRTTAELEAVGGILPDDFRRVPRNAA